MAIIKNNYKQAQLSQAEYAIDLKRYDGGVNYERDYIAALIGDPDNPSMSAFQAKEFAYRYAKRSSAAG